jgi:vancomycin resistance protein YoaR
VGVSEVPQAEEPILADVGTSEPPKRRSTALRVVLVVVLVLVAAYVAAAYFLGDRVPRDTQVAGVEIGGRTAPAAEQALAESLAEVQQQPVTLVAREAQAQINPAEAGLALDAEATVDELTGFSLSPALLLGHLLGLGPQPAVSTVDEAGLQAALQAAAEDLDTAPVEGAINLAGNRAEPVEPQDGYAVDVEETAERIRETWLEGEPVEAVLDVQEPTIGSAAVGAAMEDVAEPLTSGPIAIRTDSITTEIPVEELLAVSRIDPDGDELVLRIDGAGLQATLHRLAPQIGEAPRDATVVLQGGRPVVVPAASGIGVDPEQLAEAATRAALSTSDRTAVVDLVEVQPSFTTEQAEALRIVEKVSEFSTPLTADRQRTQNLIVGTAKINGTLVRPGETFSLLDALGPITPAAGFNESGVVVEGFVSRAVGGGLSQLATTTYNAAYFAGMEDVFHQTHSRWFDRYPEGREATIFTPSVDLTWRNNTEYGVLVQAWVAGNRTWVALWSTKYWDVRSVTGPRYNITRPTTVYNTSDDCTPESGGSPGFTVQVTRTVSRAGEVVENRTLTTRYQPWNRVVCGPPPRG